MLPSIVTPDFQAVLPSNGKKLKFRPWLVKEEKILMMAIESGETQDFIEAIKKIFTNCIEEEINFEELVYFDFEYLFLMLRAKSVGEIIELEVPHKCGYRNKMGINIEEVKVNIDKKKQNIEITDRIGVKLKYPNISTLENIRGNNTVEQTISLIADCIEVVYEGDKIYDEFTKEEIVIFIENLNKDQFTKLLSFFKEMPMLKYDLKYKCKSCGEEETLELAGLQNFFEFASATTT